MAQAPQGVEHAELTMASRRVLLDALSALEAHQHALTVVGAQAVYLRTQEANLRSAAYTSDGDISVDPRILEDQPLLEQALESRGFALMNKDQPGLWSRTEYIRDQPVEIEVDLLVPKRLAPNIGSRSVRMPPHSKHATRWVPGIEVAVADRSLMTVSSLDLADTRAVEVHVAGPVALLVAKAFKIHDRLEQADQRPHRLTDKDAGDVLRIMMTIPQRQLATSFEEMCAHPRVGDTALEGRQLLHRLFGSAAAPGVAMAVRALRGDVPETRIRALAPAYLAALNGPR